MAEIGPANLLHGYQMFTLAQIWFAQGLQKV
jgi:hypothetical protein